MIARLSRKQVYYSSSLLQLKFPILFRNNVRELDTILRWISLCADIPDNWQYKSNRFQVSITSSCRSLHNQRKSSKNEICPHLVNACRFWISSAAWFSWFHLQLWQCRVPFTKTSCRYEKNLEDKMHQKIRTSFLLI